MKTPLLLLAACIACDSKSMDTADIVDESNTDSTDDSGGVDDGNGDDDGSSPIEIEGTLTLESGHVLDPKLADDPSISISVNIVDPGECTTALHITNGIGQERTLSDPEATTQWDGRDDSGRAFDPGTTNIGLRADCDGDTEVLDQAQAFIVRLAPSTIDLGSPSDEAGQVGLAFHKKSLFVKEVSPVGDRPEYKQDARGILGSTIDRDDGSPRPAVAMWTNAQIPPWVDGEVAAHNVPTAYIGESTMMAMVQFGDVAVSEARHIAVSPWGPEPENMPAIRIASSDTIVAIDRPIEVQLGTAESTMGKHIHTVQWAFESEGEDGTWHTIPGSFETQHAYYVLAGAPALLDGSSFGASPAIPWIGVLEDTASIMEGVPATVEDTLDALRDYLFEHEYIIYDPSNGSYSDFEGAYMYWSSITAQVSSFLDRREGLSLYCHSMSCMLSALAGTHGVRAEQIVLGVSFRTNYARAAGTDSWGTWGFNSHSVVTPDDGETIWDSSIAMDGDDEPHDDSSIDEVMPRGMPGEEYMWRLTYDDIGIINQGLCYIE